MQHNRSRNCRVGDWRNSPLKCNFAFIQNRKATISDCHSDHFSSAGLILVAHLPQQTTSASTQLKQKSTPNTIFTTCLFSQPLTQPPMKKKTIYRIIGLCTLSALSTAIVIRYRSFLRQKELESNKIFKHPEDEKERMELAKQQPNVIRKTALLSGFGIDRMNDDATVDVKAQLPNRGNIKDMDIPSSTSH